MSLRPAGHSRDDAAEEECVGRRGSLVAVLAALALVAGCGGGTGTVAPETVIETVDPGAASALLEAPPAGLVVLDVRTPEEFAAGHLPGAMHLGRGIIERDIEGKVPDTSATLVLYCGGGFRSALAADNLQKMGYQSVISLDGGWRAWTEAGQPVER